MLEELMSNVKNIAVVILNTMKLLVFKLILFPFWHWQFPKSNLSMLSASRRRRQRHMTASL